MTDAERIAQIRKIITTYKPDVFYAETVAFLLDALEASQARVREWQPIETAPKDGTAIIACHYSSGEGIGEPVIVYWDAASSADYRWHFQDAELFYSTGAFSHWMPLPDPPRARSLTKDKSDET